METILFHHKFAFKCISLNKVKISLASCTVSCFAYATLLDTPLTINTITIHNSKNVYNYFICDVIGRGLGVGLASRVREGVRNSFSIAMCKLFITIVLSIKCCAIRHPCKECSSVLDFLQTTCLHIRLVLRHFVFTTDIVESKKWGEVWK